MDNSFGLPEFDFGGFDIPPFTSLTPPGSYETDANNSISNEEQDVDEANDTTHYINQTRVGRKSLESSSHVVPIARYHAANSEDLPPALRTIEDDRDSTRPLSAADASTTTHLDSELPGTRLPLPVTKIDENDRLEHDTSSSDRGDVSSPSANHVTTHASDDDSLSHAQQAVESEMHHIPPTNSATFVPPSASEVATGLPGEPNHRIQLPSQQDVKNHDTLPTTGTSTPSPLQFSSGSVSSEACIEDTMVKPERGNSSSLGSRHEKQTPPALAEETSSFRPEPLATSLPHQLSNAPVARQPTSEEDFGDVSELRGHFRSSSRRYHLQDDSVSAGVAEPDNPSSHLLATTPRPLSLTAEESLSVVHAVSPLSAMPSPAFSSVSIQMPRTPSPPPLDTPSIMLTVPETSRQYRSSSSPKRLSIRDASRSRASSNAGSTHGGGTGEMCDACNIFGRERFFCNVCQCIYCDPCWEQQAVHRSQAKRKVAGGLPHEKTNHQVAKKVQLVLAPDLNEDDREQLHMKDIDTTWFGVHRVENELPLFRDYGRYANLIAATKTLRMGLHDVTSPTLSSEQAEVLYPSLVSFVGETGAGKSTLIKFLIDLNSDDNEDFASPVVGAPGNNVSTSEDVHLYLDPDSSMTPDSQAPLLFADCEGLKGGERDPVGARLKKKLERQSRSISPSGSDQHPRRLKHISERELTWAVEGQKRSREFAVAHLYPRLLYTFSDVIVFVLKNPRVIESVLERLVEWAQAALEKSSNQPVLPHAIIALNASENNIPEELWDVDTATNQVMTELSRTVFQNATFKKWAQFWRERDRQIETVEQLIWTYYTSLNVVRIPTTGRPNLIDKQVRKLSDTIRSASKNARERKADLRMLLNADEFQPYLQTAFDHFAEDLDTPFDFVQASFTNSPIPNNFGGNILKLAIQLMETWDEVRNLEFIFEELSYVIASCIMLDATRNRIRGKPNDIFPKYLAHLDEALENFCDRHWPCEFEVKGRGRCVNVRSGHGAKGHQLKSGNLLAAGGYQSSFECNDERKAQFQENVYYKLVRIDELIRHRANKDDIPEERAAAEIHSERVLPHFFLHASKGRPGTFVSHTVCLSCLFEPPEHALPCGHIICTPCLKIYGTSQPRSRSVEITQCPMEMRAKHFKTPWEVYLKPSSCGVRVLTLDGGGVRGIIELEILKLIAAEFEDCINVQSFFDLIVGTSTGGLIALGMTARNWTLDECSDCFENFCQQAFKARKGIGIPGLSFFIEAYNHSKYETTPLENALIKSFTEDQYLFGGKRASNANMNVKVAVTATSAALNGVVFANYNRLCLGKTSYHFQRPEQPHAEVKTWEAARATSAAPNYFKPFFHEPSKQLYSDGGIYHNNPIVIADSEWKLLWSDQKDDEPDIMLSIGTGFCKTPKEKSAGRFTPKKGILSHTRNLTTLASNHIHVSLDSEATWQGYITVRKPTPENRNRYIRLNPELSQNPPKLDNVHEIPNLKQYTRLSLKDSFQIRDVGRRLAATSFYFEVNGDVAENTRYSSEHYTVSGQFHCRLVIGSEIAALGRFIKRNAVAGHDPHFIIREAGRELDRHHEVRLDQRVLDRMILRNKFFMPRPVEVTSSAKNARTEIFLCMTRDAVYPISGCPRKLHADKPTLTGNRQVLTSTNSFRWAGRTASQQKQRSNWKPPPQSARNARQDVIERYADDTHLLGSATEDDLRPTPPNSLQSDSTVNLKPKASSAELEAGFHAPELGRRQSIVEYYASDTKHIRAELDATVQHFELSTTEPDASQYFTVVHDWYPPNAQSGYLELREGEKVKVISQRADGFYFGHLAVDPRRQGWMPSSCLQAVHNLDLSKPSAGPVFEMDTVTERISERRNDSPGPTRSDSRPTSLSLRGPRPSESVAPPSSNNSSIRCPVCGVFEGDEYAVNVHVNQAHFA